MRGPDNKWVLHAEDKADLFVDTFSKKYGLCAVEENEYTKLVGPQCAPQKQLAQLRENDAKHIMDKLKVDSGTGPDLLPARILKNCSAALAKPVLLLTMCILNCGVWPQIWMKHWLAPLFKKKSVYNPGNYRGIHLTAQLSKVVERMFKMLYLFIVLLCIWPESVCLYD